MSDVDLSSISSDDLRAELDRRREAARAKGKPLRFETKEALARDVLRQLMDTKASLKAQSGTGGDAGRRRRHSQYQDLDRKIEKFTGLIDFYKRKGL